MKGDRRRPDERARRRRPGRTLALALAIVVHLVFIGFLVWSVRWQSRPPEPVVAELYAPPQKIRAPEPPPRPEPEPPPKAEPPPPPPPPPPKAEPEAADIALKAKREEERRAKEKAERDRKLAEEKKAAEAQERLARETEAMREAAEREARDRAAAQKARTEAEKAKADAEAKAKAEADARARADADAKAKAQAESNARAAAQADWVRRIQAKVRGNVVLPPDLPGNPEAIFELIQLPTGEILEAQLKKSSGVKAYDEALQRAIAKSSPLPRPDRPDLFMRTLTLRFRPQD